MKLIIDILDKDYEKLKDGHIPFSILDVMQNGIPLEQISDEIDEEQVEDDYAEWVTYYNKAVNDILMLIDNLCLAKKMIDKYR